MKYKKQGFSLIELLAVVVILAIIALIVVPLIGGIMKSVRRAAFSVGVENIVSAIGFNYNKDLLYEKTQDDNKIYNFTTKELVDTLSLKGKVPKDGTMVLTKLGKVSVAVNDGEFCAIKDFTDNKITVGDYVEGECKLGSTPEPPVPPVPPTSGEETCFEFNSTTGTILGLKDTDECRNLKNITIPATIDGVQVVEIADNAFAKKTDFDAYIIGYGDRWGSYHSLVTYKEKIVYFDGSDNVDDILNDYYQNYWYYLHDVRHANDAVPYEEFLASEEIGYDASNKYAALEKIIEYKTKISFKNGTAPETKYYCLDEFADRYITTSCWPNKMEVFDPNDYDDRLGYIESVDFSQATYLTKIGNHAFLRNNLSGTLDLSNMANLTIIGDGAFERNYITNLNLSGSTDLRLIGEDAFFKNDIETLNLSGVTMLAIINDSSFAHNKLAGTIDLSANTGIMKIDKSAFSRNALTGVNLNGLTLLESIEEDAFFHNKIATLQTNNLSSLKKIDKNAFGENFITAIDFSTCPNIEKIGKNAFHKNAIATLNLGPLTNLKEIGDYAFSSNVIANDINLKNLSNLETIGSYAFAFNSITNVSIEDNAKLKKIGGSAFRGNETLNSVSIKNLPELSNLGSLAFAYSEVKTLTMQNLPKLTKINDSMFYDNMLTSISLSDNITEIDKYAFSTLYGISSELVLQIPNSVTKIGEGAFKDLTLKGVNLGTGVSEIGDYAFISCGLPSPITIPSNVRIIGESAFADNYITAITLNEGVTKIGERAFQRTMVSTGVTSITLPASVTHIGNRAFQIMDLTSVTVLGKTGWSDFTEYGNLVFGNASITWGGSN